MERNMKTLPYKTILNGDKSPSFKKISQTKFIVKIPGGGQYSVYKNHMWNDLWHVRNESHKDIGYGLSLKQAANVVLKHYMRTMYSTWFLDDPANILLLVQFHGIIDKCVADEIMPLELTTHKQKFLCHAYRTVINEAADSMPDIEILRHLTRQIQTRIHCYQTDCDENYNYSIGDDNESC
jgi:hypothetical protein